MLVTTGKVGEGMVVDLGTSALVTVGNWTAGVGDDKPVGVVLQAARIKLAAAEKNKKFWGDFIPARIPRAAGWISELRFEALKPCPQGYAVG